jgi:hypothetical protein
MMKSKRVLCGLSMAVVLHFGVLAGSAQTNIYLFSGSETNITLKPGTYIITAYGAPGGNYYPGGLGAEMSAEFNFSTSTNLTLLVGGGGYYSYDFSYGGGGGGGSFVIEGTTPLVIAGGGGGVGNGDRHEGGRPGTVSTSGSNGSGVQDGGTGGGGGGGGNGDYPSVGGGGGGFLGNGGGGGFLDNTGGESFENGGGGGYYGGGFGGGGAGIAGGNGGSGDAFICGGGGGGYSGGGGGGINRSGGGGGSIIDSSAITNLAEVSGIASPDDPPNLDYGYSGNGEIIIIAVPTPVAIANDAAFGFTNGVFGFNLLGPSGSNVVIQASTDLQTWIPLQTNLLGSGPLYFSDPQSATSVQRFYRIQLSR